MNAIVILLFLIILPFPTASRTLSRFLKRDTTYPEMDQRENFCKLDRFDAAFKGPDGKQYYFHEYSVFIVNKHENHVTRKHRNHIFPNSPYYVDGMSYSPKTRRAYLYKNSKVWIYKYYADRFVYQRTKKLHRPSPNIIEAAVLYQKDIYLLKNKYLYAWDEAKKQVKPNHVFSIRHFWENVPSNIVAAMQYKHIDKTVFWKWQPGSIMRYYIFDNASRRSVKSGTFSSFFPFCAH